KAKPAAAFGAVLLCFAQPTTLTLTTGTSAILQAWRGATCLRQCGRGSLVPFAQDPTRYCPFHSGLMPDALMTLAHFSASSAMCFANSAGVFGAMATAPSSARRFLIAGSAMAELNCLLSVSMIAAGVFFGTPKPIHALAS